MPSSQSKRRKSLQQVVMNTKCVHTTRNRSWPHAVHNLTMLLSLKWLMEVFHHIHYPDKKISWYMFVLSFFRFGWFYFVTAKL